MKNCCFNEACERTAVILCEGHLREFILAAVANVLDEAACEQWVSMEPDEEGE